MELIWNSPEDRIYETGIDRGVLYVDGLDGVAWNGLINVTESPSGGEARPFYIDGVKYLNLASMEEFSGSITAFYSPEEFDLCDGTIALQGGVFANQQVRKPFCFSFRQKVGNAGEGDDANYKIHIVYNAMAMPTVRSYKAMSDNPEALNLSWQIVTRAIPFPGLAPTAHITIDSTKANATAVARLESVLYGSILEDPRVPFPDELLVLMAEDPFIVTDNGNGTFTVSGPDAAVFMLDDDTFRLDTPLATYLNADTYTVQSSA